MMNKLRPVRFKNMAVDMTAMCDVAFLLLAFFVATARFDQWEPLRIITPATNTFNSYLPSDNMAIIYIAKDKVMYQIVNDKTRVMTATEMAKLYRVELSAKDLEKVAASPIIGTPVCELPNYNNQYMDWVSKIDRPGIPYDHNSSELFDWIKQSRIVTRAMFNRDLRITIKADKDIEYAMLKRVTDVLKLQHVNKFSLLTEHEKTQE